MKQKRVSTEYRDLLRQSCKFYTNEIPHRYDLEQISCINKEVDKYNRRI